MGGKSPWHFEILPEECLLGATLFTRVSHGNNSFVSSYGLNDVGNGGSDQNSNKESNTRFC